MENFFSIAILSFQILKIEKEGMKDNMENKKPYNKAEYEKKNFKYQNVCFKIEEMEEIEAYCTENNIAKNTLIRQAVMKHIGK